MGGWRDAGRRFGGFTPLLLIILCGVAHYSDAQAVDWLDLVDDIARSSLLNTAPGTTIERDVQALIDFFNKTCTEAQANANDAANPYRGAFAQVSQWRQQQGWNSIVKAHSDVAVQCRGLYMEGGEEFTAKHCFWNIESLADTIVYPSPQWTIVETCCEQLNRPVLPVRDAVWATTRGVGRVRRLSSDQGATSTMDVADDEAYVPKLDCSQPINRDSLECEAQNLYTPEDVRCDASMNCPKASKPIGVRSKHYFNAGIAVGDNGVIMRTMDGGYSWDCMRGCTRGANPLPALLSVSVNVRLGGFGYSNTYYDAYGQSNVDGVDWTLLHLDGPNVAEGLDGVYWEDYQADSVYMEGYAVGAAGTIVRLDNAGVSGWDPMDPINSPPDTKKITEVVAKNPDGVGGCVTNKRINDVFFWNTHLSFFVGDQGFLCRYGLDIQPTASANGPGINVDEVLAGTGTVTPRWDSQGADELGVNWGRIIDNNDYMFSNLQSVFCLQVADLDTTLWQQPVMDPPGITYSQHIQCFAVGTHPGTPGTTSAILKYESQAVVIGTDTDGNAIFREDISWKPQNSMTTVQLNDVYCVKSTVAGSFTSDGAIYCYAVGNNGVIRYTSNGGLSAWRTLFSGVLENLNKVVIIGVTHDERGFGAGSSNAGNQAVVVGDNGRVLYTNDGGNTWEKLERVTPEHLVAIQFNAFDDFYYYVGGAELSSEYLYFDAADGQSLPFGNGIATGAVMYDWISRTGSCGVGSPNSGTGTSRAYDCRKPELSVILRTNCGGTLQSQHQRCQSECAVKDATVTVALEDTLATKRTWDAYFGTKTELIDGVSTVVSKVIPQSGKELVDNVPACDEVWTIGHGRAWHEDTRETRLYQGEAVNQETGLFLTFEDTTAIRPVHEMCMYGWPRHLYQLDKGRRTRSVVNTTATEITKADYTFLNRMRLSEANCTAMGGRYYQPETNYLEDCVFEFGAITECPSWEVHGMGHSVDPPNTPVATRIPFVNFSVISDPCNDGWFGVTCDEYHDDDALPGALPNQTITQIWLYSNNLQGDLPLSISNLYALRSFSVGSNHLTGVIPRNIWANMSQLKYLSLAENSLAGTVPETLGDLNQLEELRLHANRLSGAVPSQLGLLSRLQSISFHSNRLQGYLPSQLGQLAALQYLWMSNNNFTGAMPSELGHLSHLRYLWFANNSINSIPAQLGELSSLRSLDGSNNSIADRLPYSLGKLNKLRVMKLGNNRLRATIPDALGMCISLVVLELQHNELVGPVPASFGALEELTLLDISHNLLERTLPNSIEGMRNLQTLLLNDNAIEGGLPTTIGTLIRLAKLNMANNQLTDALPDELANCDMLEMLDLQANRIDGPLPAGIWRLKLLEYLYLTGNSVRGPLPEGIGYLAQIRELRLDSNKIDGTIPATIGDANTLKVMRMDDNLLSGSIPSTVGKLRNVQILDLHDNSIMGTIPPEISGMASVVTVYLHENQLQGQMPSTIGELTMLQELRASRNQLTGVIPPSFGKLASLATLALDDNQIGGAIPQDLGNLKEELKVLHLQGNRLNGLLPTFFSEEEFRTVAINLANNEFWCPLPAWPALNNTASCRHCPNDLYLDDVHRTCSDHGICKDGSTCICDPKWTGDTCNLLRCPSQCSGHGECINEVEPETCSLDSIASGPGSVTADMCINLSDDCVAAYHECPSNGISVQVDSTGIIIAEEAKHNNIVFAKCICTDAYFGNDCSMPPLPPPTVEPWPDPYDQQSSAHSSRSASWESLLLSATTTAAVAYSMICVLAV